MTKKDLERQDLLDWNRFATKPLEEALPAIYKEATEFSKRARHWYWASIARKRVWSVWARAVSYAFAVYGVVGPLIAAAAHDADGKLWWTQSGVAALAMAGVVQLGDKVFGWSSGWLRYITTVTAMEKLSLQFELDWAAYFLGKKGNVGVDDVVPLFALARQLGEQIEARRSDETDAWVAEFNAGIAALGERIKFQKDAVEKAAQSARAAAETREQGDKAGAIELTIVRATGPAKPLTVYLDDRVVRENLLGSSCVVPDVAPGLYRVRVAGDLGDEGASKAIWEEKSVTVLAGASASVSIRFP